MMIRKAMVIGAALAWVAPAAAVAQNDGWTVIGFASVGKRGDTDVITVSDRRKFGAVRLCVFNRPIQMNNFDVTFGNGHRQNLVVRDTIRAGGCTRAIDLKGNRRHVESVLMRYRRLPGDGAPLVRIQAR